MSSPPMGRSRSRAGPDRRRSGGGATLLRPLNTASVPQTARVVLSDSGAMLNSAPMESESLAPASARPVSLAADEPADYSDGARLLGWDIQTFALRSRFRASLVGVQTAGAQLTRVDAAAAHIARGESPRDAYVLVLSRRMQGLTRI